MLRCKPRPTAFEHHFSIAYPSDAYDYLTQRILIDMQTLGELSREADNFRDWSNYTYQWFVCSLLVTSAITRTF